MSGAIRVAGVAVIAAILALLLREAGFKGSRLVAIVGTVGLLGLGASGLATVFEFLSGRASGVPEATEIVSAAIRIVGLGYIFGICSDVCRELGENGVAGATLVVGRVEIFLAVLPHLDELMDLVTGLLGG